ncbi:fluoride efflux transporter CrcB [Nocardiopsis gilva YIM 90087]|uniref:Fluoride-specific ion channel FluC n=1 Tax=Nocardiopsis gilva YIM 90087 TaxID=1235441 RepID=A0A223S1H2_9ACTN|nr:fluoride efflux transporter CrcB [Nocardiopsis gilva]ASU81971.1 fluoride efflux transporter CrcB [Nocardiopsis gilva YIM 90087]
MTRPGGAHAPEPDPGLAHLPVDSDVDLHFPRQVGELREAPWAVPAAIALGGALGAAARYGIGVLLPHAPGEFALSTLLINVSGCLLIGFLMVVVTDVRPELRLARPFFGVGMLGGYTTFSTYIVDVQQMLNAGAAGPALLYLGGTLIGAMAAVWAGIALAERVFRARIAARRERDGAGVGR